MRRLYSVPRKGGGLRYDFRWLKINFYNKKLDRQSIEKRFSPMVFNISMRHLLFVVVMFFILYQVYHIIEPFLIPIFFSIVMAIVTTPFYNQTLKWLKGRKGFSSAFTCLILFFIFALPLFIVGGVIISQALDLYNTSSWLLKDDKLENLFLEGQKVLTPYLQWLYNTLGLNQHDVLKSLSEIIRKISMLLYINLSVLLKSFTNVIVSFFEVIFITFYLLIDGPAIVNKIFFLLPCSTIVSNRLREDCLYALHSILWGTVVLAIIQGIGGGIGFWFFGVPHAFFWGTVMTFASVVPLLGTALVWIPASIYLMIMNSVLHGIGIIIWCFFTSLFCDNILRPKLLGGQVLHPLLIFFSVLGGVTLFGLSGIILGPLILAIFFSLINIYQYHFLNEKNENR